MAFRNKNTDKTDSVQRTINNSAKTLLANIRFMSVDEPVRTVVITSTIPNEGKTFVAANLARAMATSGKHTLIVECDMRRRSMASTLNIHAQHGFYAVMSDEIDLMDAVVPTGIPYLDFLDAEPHIPNPSDLLNSRRFYKLIDRMRREYDYVVFDTPPVGTFVDAAVLGAKVDATFLVVREQFVRKNEVARAAEQLKTANAHLAGIVMNFCEHESNSYYYDYYYREGQAKKRTEGEFAAEATNEYDLDALKAANEEAQTPRSWSNAPDLGDETIDEIPVVSTASGEYDHSLVTPPDKTGPVVGAHVRAQRFKVPSIGETNALSRDDIDMRSVDYNSQRDQ